ncbi:MAG TPA: formate dehydrogenase, partial [Acidimicrobiia bacterium]|nr:formate dehydrogenase [Acidimicrobiia bacterium]
MKSPRRTRRSLWVGWKPYGIGETRPNAYKEILRTIWQNRRNLPYAFRILRKGVCDGCALGVAGFHDWTLSGVHLCTTRLALLRVNTMRALDPDRLADVGAL